MSADASSSAARLGFPDGARLLIVNCDDFGMDLDISAAVIESIEEGIARSCSLMTVGPAAADAVRRLRRRPGVAFGVHLSLVCEAPDHRWGPLTPRERVPSLLDPDGHLFAPTPAGRAALLGQARLDEVEVEFRAQIDAVTERGLAPTHLDFHCLADGGRDDIFDLTLELAAQYGLSVRAWLDRGRDAARARGMAVVDHPFLDSFSLDTVGKTARYLRMLRELPPGLTEWAVHPSLARPRSPGVDDGRPVRRTDYEFLVSPQARRAIADEGITVVSRATAAREGGQRGA